MKNKMTNEQILKQAIEKAVKNGWESEKKIDRVSFNGDYVTFALWDKERKYFSPWATYPREAIIFSHNFAKAFWGEEKMKQEGTKHIGNNKPEKWIYYIPAWRHHLQQMVLEKSPILYLKKFL